MRRVRGIIQRLPRGAFAAATALLFGLSGPALGRAAPATDQELSFGFPVVGYAYVNDNTAGANTVAGFARHLEGSLTALPNSPFNVGGAGTGAGIGSQGAVQVSDDGRYLLAVDAGSNQISVARIREDGALQPVEGGPVSSNGVEPVSIAVHGGLVYVANTGNGGTNYTGFTLDSGGNLRPIPGSTVPEPDGSSLGDVLIDPNGLHLAGTRVATSLIDSFDIGRDGRLSAAPGSPYAAQAAGPFGSAFRPAGLDQLFVSNAHAGPGNGTVSSFSVAPSGALSPVGGSPFPDFQTAPCWVAISPDGRYLFATNTASDSISSYKIARDGTLTLLGSTTLRGGTGQGALGSLDLRLDPAGRALYVVDSKKAEVSALSVDDGILTELPSSPMALPAGAKAFGLAIAPR